MSEPRVEALLRHESIPGLPEDVRAAHKKTLRAQIAADPATSTTSAHTGARPRRRWRPGGITLLAGGLLLVGAGAATAFLTRAQPDDPEIVRCFSIAAPPFTSGAPGSYDASYGPGDGTLDQSAALAIELCGYGWAEGRLPWPETKPPGYTNPDPQPVAELQACILPDGIVGVFPGDQRTYTQLGLPESAARP
jgi:hypothetical protein